MNLSKSVLFIDLATVVVSTQQLDELNFGFPVEYVQEEGAGIEYLAENTPSFVILSVTELTDVTAQYCSVLEHANPDSRTYIVLMVPETIVRQSCLSLPGVVGFVPFGVDWQVAVKQFNFIEQIAFRFHQLEHAARASNFAKNVYSVSACTVDCGSGECRADASLLHDLNLINNIPTSEGFHWKRLLEAFQESDRESLVTCVDDASRNGKDWNIKCSTLDRQRHFECRGFVHKTHEASPNTINIIWHRIAERSEDFQYLMPSRSNNQDLLNERVQSYATGSLLLVQIKNRTSLCKSVGPEIFEQTLIAAREQLSSCVRASDLVFSAQTNDRNIVRIDGATILVVLDGIVEGTFLTNIQSRLVEVLRRPLHVGERSIPLRCLVGGAVWPRDGVNANDLLHIAALDAKQHLQSIRASHYKDAESSEESYRLETDLYDAITKDELALVFQPKYRLTGDTAMVGVEALVRWHRNRTEWVPPDVFIPIAERNGLILAIGKWVIEEAIRWQVGWLSQGSEILPMSINVSAEQFMQPDFIFHLEDRCHKAGIPPEAIELEITESCLIENANLVIDVLEKVKAKGFSIALDDFGTGFSSLSYLRTLPLDVLKIDRSFVASLDGENYDPALTAGIIGIGLALGLRIIAEGIETPAQWQLLGDWGCHQGQGYLMSRPVFPEEIGSLRQIPFELADSADVG